MNVEESGSCVNLQTISLNSASISFNSENKDITPPSSNFQGNKRKLKFHVKIPLKYHKPNKVFISEAYMSPSTTEEYLAALNTYLVCSVCEENKNEFMQCIEGHLICSACLKGEMIYCKKCDQFFNIIDLSFCKLSMVVSSLKTSICELCHMKLPMDDLKNHQVSECLERVVGCVFQIYGCGWSGTFLESTGHMDICSLRFTTANKALELYTASSKDQNKLNAMEITRFKTIYYLASQQENGFRFVIKNVILLRGELKFISSFIKLIKFRSNLIGLPFSCCSTHGFYVNLIVVINLKKDDIKIRYTLNSESETKSKMYFSVFDFKLDLENSVFQFLDTFHEHYFTPQENESTAHEITVCNDNDRNILIQLNIAEKVNLSLCVLANDNKDLCAHNSDDQLIDNLFSLIFPRVVPQINFDS